MTDSVEKEILQRLTRIETAQDKMEERNASEHQEIMASIESLKDKDDDASITNGKQNERLVELETAFSSHIEEEHKEKSAYMWRFGIIVSLIVFGGDLLLRFFGM